MQRFLLVLGMIAGAGCQQSSSSLFERQYLGTHNSYHVITTPLAPLDYGYDSLASQLDLGVRQFELDIQWIDDELRVFHIVGIDEGTNCRTLRDCLQDMKAWSDAHAKHEPLVVLLEIKTEFDQQSGPQILSSMTQDIDATFADQVFQPSDLGQGTPRDSLATAGWPQTYTLQGRLMPILHTGGLWHDSAGTDSPFWLDGRGDLSRDDAVFHSINDPFDPILGDVLQAGMLVRTRADADVKEPAAGDTARRDQALASGAHFISTDFVLPHPQTGYLVELGIEPTDKEASRCNPVTGDC